MKNNQLQAIIVADSVQAKNILESNINQLKIALEGNNIEIDKVSVFVGNEENNFAWGVEVVASHDKWTIRDDVEWPFENPSFFQDLFTAYQSLTALHGG